MRVNYRTSHQIRMQAARLLGPEVTDVDGHREERNTTVSAFNGPPPAIRVFATMDLAKGLEFRAVAVMACDDEMIPSRNESKRSATKPTCRKSTIPSATCSTSPVPAHGWREGHSR